MIRVSWLLLVGAAVVAGCAESTPRPWFGDGWRPGIILKIGVPETLGRPLDADCRSRFAGEDLEDRPFALVQYFSGRVAHIRTVPLPAEVPANVGDAVLVGFSGCREFVSR